VYFRVIWQYWASTVQVNVPEQGKQGIWEAAEVGVTTDAWVRVQLNVAEYLDEYKLPTYNKFTVTAVMLTVRPS